MLLQRCVQPVARSCQVSRHWTKPLQKPLAQSSAADLLCHNPGPQWYPRPAHVCWALKLPQLPLSSPQPGASPGTGFCDPPCLGEPSQIPEQNCSCPVKMLGNVHSPTTALLLSASKEGSLCLFSTKSVFHQNWLLLKHWRTSQHPSLGYRNRLWKATEKFSLTEVWMYLWLCSGWGLSLSSLQFMEVNETQLSWVGFSPYQTVPLLSERLAQVLPTPQTSATRAFPPSVSSHTQKFLGSLAQPQVQRSAWTLTFSTAAKYLVAFFKQQAKGRPS